MRKYAIKIFDAIKPCIPWFLQKGGVAGKWIDSSGLNWITVDGQSWGAEVLERHLSWLKCLLVPLQVLCDKFSALVNKVIYNITITGQVMYLEHLLNDKLDPVDRRITLTDGDIILPPHIYYSYEAEDPVYVQNLILYTEEDYNGGMVRFIINIPSDIIVEDIYIKSLIEPYKRVGAQYEINRI